MSKWDYRFLRKAEHIATWSKDIHQVAAVIYDNQNRPVSEGFNGLPRKISDKDEIYANGDRIVIHAEINAILFAHKDLTDCTIYVSRPTCALCAALIIQSGISQVVVVDKLLNAKWQAHDDVAAKLYKEAEVRYVKLTIQ